MGSLISPTTVHYDIMHFLKEYDIFFSDKGESWESWPVCKVGKAQSPIDFNTSKMKKATYEDFTFVGYNRVTKKDNFVNNAHTVQMESTYQPQVRKN